MKLFHYYLMLVFLNSFYDVAKENKDVVAPNENLITENIPEISKDLANKVKKYTEARGATLAAVHPITNEIVVATRFGTTPQLHQVKQPLGDRTQITFFDEPVSNAIFEPTKGNYLIYSADASGNEFGQLYKLDLKTLESTLLTAGGRSQNGGVTWRKDGKGFYYSSTKRNGKDRDIYFMDPENLANEKLVLEVKGGGWGISDISSDYSKLLIRESISANESYVWLLEVETGKLIEVTDRKTPNILQSGASFSKNNNEIWLMSDKDNEFERLGTFDLTTKKFTFYTSSIPWSVENYTLSEDQKTLVFTTNESGSSKMYIMDTATKLFNEVKSLPPGLLSSMRFTSDDSAIFFTQSTAKSASDVFKLVLKTGEITRWTKSELGQIQESDISLPKAISWKSFDKLTITGFYYPASPKFKGKRPVVINIHGGPEGQ